MLDLKIDPKKLLAATALALGMSYASSHCVTRPKTEARSNDLERFNRMRETYQKIAESQHVKYEISPLIERDIEGLEPRYDRPGAQAPVTGDYRK